MHNNRIEITRGHVVSVKTIGEDCEVVEAFSGSNRPAFFFVDLIENNHRHDVWSGDEYQSAIRYAQLAKEKSGYQVSNLAGCNDG